ncbi:MAG: hypothetical protein ABL971_16515 [Vicinamibacterales bacterium]
MVRLLLDETLRQSMGQRAMALGQERYSSSRVAKRLIGVYDDIFKLSLRLPDASQPISVVVLNLNEEADLPQCLTGVRDWACQVFVVDAGSTRLRPGGESEIASSVNLRGRRPAAEGL